MSPLFTAFYTVGTRYEAEAARLRRSLHRLSLEHQLRPIEDRGDWRSNTHQTARHIAAMMDAHPQRPIVQLDADAVVMKPPELFDELSAGMDYEGHGPDIAAHWLKGSEFLNGTLWLAPTKACRAAIGRYVELCTLHPTFRDEQQFLRQAIDETPGLRVCRLPASYCFIHSFSAAEVADEDVVVEHLQASRESTGSTLLPARRSRIEQLEAVHPWMREAELATDGHR